MSGLPRLVQPMLAILRRQLPADDDRYGWEFKWDGVRAIAYVSGKRVRLLSRNDNDMTGSYPELAVLAERVQVPVILDGEIVALYEGRPDFGVLQSRMHVRRPRARLINSVPVQLYVFDLLYRGEDSLLGLSYTERRARLEDLGLDADPVRTPPWYRDDAQAVQAVSLQHWRTATGRRRSLRAPAIRSCAVGLMRLLAPLERETSPFAIPAPPRYTRGARWVDPRLVGNVGTGFTGRELTIPRERLLERLSVGPGDPPTHWGMTTAPLRSPVELVPLGVCSAMPDWPSAAPRRGMRGARVTSRKCSCARQPMLPRGNTTAGPPRIPLVLPRSSMIQPSPSIRSSARCSLICSAASSASVPEHIYVTDR